MKLPGLAEEAVFTSTMLRMYLREAGFFGELADQAPRAGARLPPLPIDPETSQFVLVMEDIGGLRVVDQVEGHGDRRRRAGRRRPGRLARHLVGQGARRSPSAGVTVSLGDPIYKAVLPMVFAEGWEKLGKELDASRRHPGGRPPVDRRHARPRSTTSPPSRPR